MNRRATHNITVSNIKRIKSCAICKINYCMCLCFPHPWVNVQFECHCRRFCFLRMQFLLQFRLHILIIMVFYFRILCQYIIFLLISRNDIFRMNSFPLMIVGRIISDVLTTIVVLLVIYESSQSNNIGFFLNKFL